MKTTPARLYLIYVASGLILLLLIIICSRLFRQADQVIMIYVAISISIANALVVLGYTLAVKREEELLSDQDAPDLAYYLGFSLTVGALAFSFLSDILIGNSSSATNQAIIERSLVKGSLAQFGAGLLATLFGLSAKIYLTSVQLKTQLDPDDLYRKFRYEVNSLGSLMGQVSSELNISIRNSVVEINTSAQSASQSFIKLSSSIAEATRTISENLSPEKVSLPVQKFTDQLELLSLPIEKLNQEVGLISSSVVSTNTLLKTLDSSVISISTSIRQGDDSLQNFSTSIENINNKFDFASVKVESFIESTDKSIESINRLTTTTEAVSKIFDEISINAKSLSVVIKQNNDSLIELLSSTNQLRDIFVQLEPKFVEFEQNLENGGNAISSFTTNLQSSSLIVSEFSRTISGVLEQVNLLSTSVVSVIDRLRLNNAAINQSNIDLSNLQNTFQSINNVISNLITSAADISIKFNQVRDSLNSLNGNSLTFNENLSSINIQLTNTKDSLSQFSTAVSSASLAMENIVMRGSSV